MIKFTLTSEAVRQACIRNEWFTQGTTADYNRVLDHVENFGKDMVDFEAENLVWDVAADIRLYSDTDRMMRESGCTYAEIGENIAYVLLNACRLSF